MAENDQSGIEVLNPQGQRGTIPAEQVDAALGQGYKLTKHTVMYDSNGTKGLVPNEQRIAATQAGYTDRPATEFERSQQNNRGLLGTLLDKAKGVLSGPSLLPPTAEEIAKGPGGPSGPREMFRQATRPLPDLPYNAITQAEPGNIGVGRAIYRTATTLSPLVPGLNPEASEAASARGDTGAVVAEAVVPAAATAAGYGVAAGARRLLAPPSPAKGLGLYERTVAPGGMKAEGQLASRETFNRAAPYLAAQERETPVFNKQPGDPGTSATAGQEMGVMNYRQNALAAGQKLWGNIEPRARMYQTAPLEPTKAGITTSQAVAATVNPTEAVLNPGKVAGVQNLADFTGKIGTVGEALDRIQELNADKGVQAYEKALPDKQAELLKGDPTIEGKITAANTLRDQVFDSIEKHGNPDDANWIRGARQDYGAIQEVAKNLGNTQVPTPAPLSTRIANSTRMILSPTFAREYLSKPVSTLFDLNNPNRLAIQSSQALGASTLEPPTAPPIRVTPWDPSVRPTGPVVGPLSGRVVPMTGGSGGPAFTPPQTPVPPTGPGANPALFPDIPSGQVPSSTLGAGEVPNWPPKVPAWGPSPPPAAITSVESTIPLETPYGPPNTQGPPPLPPGITQEQWNALPAATRNRFGLGTPTPGTFSPGGVSEVTPQGAPLPSSTPLITVAPPTQPTVPSPSGAPPPAPLAPTTGTSAAPPTGGTQVPPTMPSIGESDIDLATRRPPLRPNASAEFANSPETERAQGIRYYKETPDGRRTPYISNDPGTAKLNRGERIIRQDAEGNETIL